MRELEQYSRLSALHDWFCRRIGISDNAIFCPSSRTLLLEQSYRNALSVLDLELQDLLFRSMELIRTLDEIDERLRTILSLVRAEEAHVSLEKDLLLHQYWTVLGFNKRELLHFDRTINALFNVGSYTARARQFIAGTHASLHEMQEDVEQLRKASAEGANGRWLTLEEATWLVRDGISRLQSAQTLRERKTPGDRRGKNDIRESIARSEEGN